MRHIVKLFLAYAIASAAFQACAEPVAPQAPQAHHDVCSGGGYLRLGHLLRYDTLGITALVRAPMAAPLFVTILARHQSALHPGIAMRFVT